MSEVNGDISKKSPIDKDYVFWSPLNEKFEIADRVSRCTWHKNVDFKTSPHTKDDWRRTSKILPDILHAIGNTPIVKLNKIPQCAGLKCNVYAKCEFMNPGGSMKDRIGYRMVEDAEKQGIVKPGCTIIEPSSGNTGVGVALSCAVKGYRCIITISEKMSNEKVSVLKSLGAEVIRTPVTAGSYAPDGMFGVAHRVKTEIPNSVILDQFSNPGNPLAHYDTTAEELLDQCDHKIDMIVMGAGTGGTVTGVGRKIKEVSPKTIVVGVDPEGSVFALPESLNETDVTFYEVEGLGYDFVPTALDREVVDFWIKTNDADSLVMARRLIREEGLLCGTSSGAAMVAALKAAKDLKEGDTVVVVLPDSIRNYLTKFISDHWMEARNLKPCVNVKNHWWWENDISCLDIKQREDVLVGTSCEEVLQKMKRLTVNQIPVVNKNGFIVGMVTLRNLINGFISKDINPNDPIERLLIRIFPKANISSNLGLVSRILEREPYVTIVKTEGSNKCEKPVGVIEAKDLFQYISANGVKNENGST